MRARVWAAFRLRCRPSLCDCRPPLGRMACMVIVAGHLVVPAEHRDEYLSACADVVRAAREAPGCLDFALSADLLQPERVNVYECWRDAASVEAFRGSGPRAGCPS